MDITTSEFHWDSVFFEKKLTFLSNMQMGFIGAALMLMMMNLSKLYLLAPLVIGLILISWYKHHLDQIKKDTQGCTVQFAPKSILISFPKPSSTLRITFKNIEDVHVHTKYFIPIISIYLKNDEEKIQLKAMKRTKQLAQQLKAALNKAT